MEYFFNCPACGKKLSLKNKSLFCENGHCYDLAKSGYVNLLLANKKNSVDPGDNPEMIKARELVMNADYYKDLASAIIEELNPYDTAVIADVGCGIGYIPYRLKQFYFNSTVVGTDISKNAIVSASKRFKNIPFAVASSINLPFDSKSVSAVICAFAPVFREEFLRVLKDGGIFIRITPDINHLMRLKQNLYSTPRPNELDPEFIEGFSLISQRTVVSNFQADGELLPALVKMTPYYYHTSKEDFEKLCKLPSLDINTEFNLRVYKKI